MKVIFLDRDGVINKDFGYVGDIKRFEFIDGVFEALKKLQNEGFEFIIVTNQSGIKRGFYTKDDFLRLTQYMLDEFKKEGIEILDIFYCPHTPNDGCFCRKPNPGMFFEAFKKYKIDIKNSWMIGDKRSDIEAAKKAGIENRILLKKKGLFDTIDIIKNKRGEYEI